MVTVKTNNLLFIHNKERNGLVGNVQGSMMLCESSFIDKFGTKSILPSELVLVESKDFMLQCM